MRIGLLYSTLLDADYMIYNHDIWLWMHIVLTMEIPSTRPFQKDVLYTVMIFVVQFNLINLNFLAKVNPSLEKYLQIKYINILNILCNILIYSYLDIQKYACIYA